MNAQRDELGDYGKAMQEAWESGAGTIDIDRPLQFDTDGIPILGDYTFGATRF